VTTIRDEFTFTIGTIVHWMDTPDVLDALGIDHDLPAEKWREAMDPRHQVEFRADGWTVAHPLAERLDGSLFDCPVEFSYLDRPPSLLGRFWIESDGSRTPCRAVQDGES
jgi:hypothetical protein